MKVEELALLIDLLDKLGQGTEGPDTAGPIFARLRTLTDRTGYPGDAPSPTGTISARLAELLTNRLTSTRAAYLDAINNLILVSRLQPTESWMQSSLSPTTSWVTVLSITDVGYLDTIDLNFRIHTDASDGSGRVELRITIDNITRIFHGPTVNLGPSSNNSLRLHRTHVGNFYQHLQCEYRTVVLSGTATISATSSTSYISYRRRF